MPQILSCWPDHSPRPRTFRRSGGQGSQSVYAVRHRQSRQEFGGLHWEIRPKLCRVAADIIVGLLWAVRVHSGVWLVFFSLWVIVIHAKYTRSLIITYLPMLYFVRYLQKWPGYITVKYLGSYALRRHVYAPRMSFTAPIHLSYSNPDKSKYFARNKNVFREYLNMLLKLDVYISTIVFASSRRIE